MELFIFARFHAREGEEAAVAEALREVSGPTRLEKGCLFQQGYRSIRDARLFYVHSRWKNEAAFDLHATLPHTTRFVAKVQPLIDHPLDVTRAGAGLVPIPVSGVIQPVDKPVDKLWRIG